LASSAQPLDHLGRVVLVLRIHCRRLEHGVLPRAASFAVGEHVSEKHPTAVPVPFGSQLARLDHPHHGGPRNPQEVGRLLSRQLRLRRRDRDRLPRSERHHNLEKRLVHRRRQLDLLPFVTPDQDEPPPRSRPSLRGLGLQEAEHLRRAWLRALWDVRLCGQVRTHRSSSVVLNEHIVRAFVSFDQCSHLPTTRFANASTAFTTAVNRGDQKRSKPCCPPGSSAYTTGACDTERSRPANSRAFSTGTTESWSPCTPITGGASAPTVSVGDVSGPRPKYRPQYPPSPTTALTDVSTPSNVRSPSGAQAASADMC